MLDIHCHLLYEVDDGSQSIEESVEMVKQYIETGYSGCVATSHYHRDRVIVDSDTVYEKIKALKKELAGQEIHFDIYPGSEIYLDEKSLEDIRNGKALTINNSSYVLCELPFRVRSKKRENILYEMKSEGLRPIIAHPERCKYVQKNPNLILEFVEKGYLVQMNLYSLLRDSTKDLCKDLLNKDLITVVGTDAHRSVWRSPLVGDCLLELKKIVGEKRFELLTEDNPEKIVNNIPIRPIKRKKDYKYWKKECRKFAKKIPFIKKLYRVLKTWKRK